VSPRFDTSGPIRGPVGFFHVAVRTVTWHRCGMMMCHGELVVMWDLYGDVALTWKADDVVDDMAE
jgi:hypothetical protein